MSDTPKTPQTQAEREKAERARRLAQALRDNLRRRKGPGAPKPERPAAERN